MVKSRKRSTRKRKTVRRTRARRSRYTTKRRTVKSRRRSRRPGRPAKGGYGKAYRAKSKTGRRRSTSIAKGQRSGAAPTHNMRDVSITAVYDKITKTESSINSSLRRVGKKVDMQMSINYAYSKDFIKGHMLTNKNNTQIRAIFGKFGSLKKISID